MREKMQTRLRKVGIDVLGEMAWGSHLCLFYETRQDLLEMVVPYFRAGLENNEFCVWAVSDPVTVEDAKVALKESIRDFDEHLAAGSIEIIPASEWYLKGGEFDLKRVTSGWYAKLRDAMDGGYSGMRASGEAFWLETKHWARFIEYEQELDRTLNDQPLTILCTYAVPASGAADLLEVVKAHQFTVTRRGGKWEVLEAPPTEQDKSAVSVQNATTKLARLTPREREVLTQLARGAKSKEIAHRLGIADSTVDVYRTRILLKTNSRNLPELVRLAIFGGLDSPRLSQPSK